MHGNPHAPSGLNHSDNAELNVDAVNVGAALWLGLPAARQYFDPSALSEPDHLRFVARRGPRRRADFEVSRALLAFAGAGTPSSLSHSAEHAALLVAPGGCRTGVDLEINRPRDVLRLARFAFDEREAVALEAAPEDARSQLFYTLWTLKESFAKALQLDLSDALRQCVFWNEAGQWRGELPTRDAWTAIVFQPRPYLYLAAACVGAQEIPGLSQWEWPPQRRGDWPVIACAAAPASAGAAPV
jgi:phosphopantetheinyl transferase